MKKHLLFIAFVVLGLSSCKKDEPITREHKPITSLELIKTKDAIINEETLLELIILPNDMNSSGELIWTSSNEAIATFNPDNRTVKGLKLGTVTITVASKENPSITSSCTVTVLEKVVTFEDAIFEKLMLEKFDANKDKRITGEEVDKVVTLSIPNIGNHDTTRIKSIKGIEAFLSLETLDVSNNPNLASLVLYEMKDDPAAKAEEAKPKKAVGTTKLKDLNISGTAINTLVLDECKAIESLNLSNTKFSAFDFTKAAALKTLDISETLFTEADFNKCAALETLTAKSSALKFADLSNNEHVKAIDFTGNKSIEKVLRHKNAIPDANWKVESSTLIEEGTYDPRAIVIPDAAFKAYIVNLFDTNKDGKIYAEEAEQIIVITLTDANIQTITGSEKFTNLESITISNQCNKLKRVDLTMLNKLTKFNSENEAVVLFEKCTSLESLAFASATKDVVIKNMPNLIKCHINNPATVETLAISGCSNLGAINNSAVATINLTDYTNLVSFEIIDCDKSKSIEFNGLTKLTSAVIKSAGIWNVAGTGTKIKSFNTESLPALSSLNLGNASALESLDLTTNSKLKYVTATGSLIKSLNLSKNTLLQTIDVRGNKIETLDVSNNKELTKLDGTGNPLATVIIYKDQVTTGFTVPSTTKFEPKQ